MKRFLPFYCTILCFCTIGSSLFSATWNTDANGNWNNDGNWITPPTFPNGIDAQAIFGNVITANRTITLGIPIVVGNVNFDDNNNYTITSNTLGFQTSSGNAGINVTNVNGNGAHSIQSALTLTSNLDISQSSTSTFSLSGIISGGGNLTKLGTGTVSLAASNTYTGNTIINAGTFALTGSGSLLSTGAVSVNNATSIFDISGITSSTTIGDLSGVTGSNVNFGSKALFLGTSASTTFAGVMQGSGGIIKQGSGTFTVTGLNTYTGGTTINAGTITITGSGVIASNSVVVNAGTLNLIGSGSLSSTSSVFLNDATSLLDASGLTTGSTTIGDLTGIAGSIVNLGANTFNVGGSNTVAYAGVIQGTGAMVKKGTGAWTISGSNTYSGGTTISTGTLVVSSNANLGNASSGVALTGGTLQITSTFSSSRSITTSSLLGAINVTGGATLTLTAGIADGISSGRINKANSGILVLLGANTYSGGTLISGGTLSLSGSGTLSSTGNVSMSGGLSTTFDISSNTSSGVTIADLSGVGTVNLGSKTLTAGTSTPLVTFSGRMIGTGSVVKQGSGTWIFTGSGHTYTGGTTIQDGTLTLSSFSDLPNSGVVSVNSATSIFDISPNGNSTIDIGDLSGVTGSTVNLGFNFLSINASSSETFAGTIQGSGGILKQGSGTSIFTGSNTYTGGTQIDAGTLSISGSGSLASTANVHINGASAIFDIGGTGSGATIGDLSGIVNSSVTLGAKTLTVGTGTAFVTFDGTMSGGGGAIAKQGSGTWILTAGNTYTGGTLIDAGTLSLSGSGALAPTGAVSVNSGAEFDISAITSGGTAIGDLSGASLSNVILGSKTLTVGTATASTTFGGIISGQGDVIKEGTGNWILTGVTIHSGGGSTTINNGTMTVNGSIIGGPVFVQSGATLKGTGTVQDLTVANGGIVAPGNSIGILHSGPVTFNAGSIFQVEIDPSNASLLDVTGSATLAGNVQVLQDAGDYPSSGNYEILTASNITGAFDPVVLGGFPGFSFNLNQIGNSIFLSYGFTPIPSSVISTVGLSGNAQHIANYLNANASSSTLDLLAPLSGKSLQNALNSVSPARNAFAAYITEQTAFSLSDLITAHLDSVRFAGQVLRSQPSQTACAQDAIAFLIADNNQEIAIPLLPIEKKREKFSVWISGFAEYANQPSSSQNPAFHYLSEAALMGLDYYGANRDIMGGTLGYAHTHFSESRHAGHGDIDYYFAALYGHAAVYDFYFSPAIWGIVNRTENRRHISFPDFSQTAKAHIHSKQFLPHLEIGYDVMSEKIEIVPFTSVDWALSWQNGYKEHGAAPFNAKQKSIRTSIIRSETGLKISLNWEKNWGSFSLQEKIAYVYEKPFGTHHMNMVFVGTPGSFTVAAVNKPLNLGAIGLNFVINMGKIHPVEVLLNYEGEFGNRFCSNQLMLNIAKKF